jgi:hypothetical protein
MQTVAALDPRRAPRPLANNGGYGALRPAQTQNTGEPLLAVP